MSLYEDWKKSGVSQRTFASKLVESGKFPSVSRARLAMWEERKKDKARTPPKILFFDIEITPMIVPVYQLYDIPSIPYDNILKDWLFLSYSARWLGEKTFGEILTPDEIATDNDSRITKALWKLLDEADLVISFNGRRFDHKKLNTRFLKWHLPPPSFYHIIDLYPVAKATFGFPSNALDYILKFLDLPRKIENEKGLVNKVLSGDKKALKAMLNYNLRDTSVLEDLYFILRPYIKNHPNIAVYHSEDNTPVCRNCGSPEIATTTKLYPTLTGIYKTWRCNKCGALGRSKTNELSKEKRASLLR